MSVASVALNPALEELVSFPGFIGQFGLNVDDPILIFLTIAGSLIPMRVMESDSIAAVKLRIQSIKGFFVKMQKLMPDGKELSQNDSRDYAHADGKLLHLVIRFSDLQAISVTTVGEKELEFVVERSRNVGYLKQQIASEENELGNPEDHELTLDGEKLEDQRLITDLSKNGESVIHLLIRKSAKVRAKPVGKDFEVTIENVRNNSVNGRREYISAQAPKPKDFFVEPVVVNPEINLPSLLKDLISSTLKGLENGNGPIQSSDGSGGAYFMQDPSGHKFVSVFKPIDEEPMAVNNPHGLSVSVDGEGLKKGTRVGEGALREVAAYVLDYPLAGPRTFPHDQPGFAGVPPTTMVKCLHKDFNHPNGYTFSLENTKIGSLQMFVTNVGTCEDMGYRAFPVDQVHKISVLDIRLANTDRHAGNILVSRDGKDGGMVLTPIDHGYCFPNKFEDCTFEWLYWPQSKEPYSSETLEYIKSLDPEQDMELLRRFHGWEIPPLCARVFRISTMLLKKGSAKGLTPFAIGSIMCRETLKKKSMIEQIINDAEAIVTPEITEEEFISTVSTIMDHCLDQYSQN